MTDGIHCPRCGKQTNFWVMQRGGESICCGCADEDSRAKEKTLTVVRRDHVPFKVRMMTLVGFPTDTYPLSRGNCCSFPSDHEFGIACRNMCAENVDEWRRRNPDIKDVEVEIMSDGSCRVVDPRIPPEWRQHTCSVHGYWGG